MEGVVAAAADGRGRHRAGGRQGHGGSPRALAPEADQSSHAHPGSIPVINYSISILLNFL